MSKIKFELKGIYETHQVFLNGTELDVSKSQKLSNHSPDGFSWGYGGSGPSQLSLAILYELTNDAEYSLRNYQSFKWDFISKLPQNDFIIEYEIEY